LDVGEYESLAELMDRAAVDLGVEGFGGLSPSRAFSTVAFRDDAVPLSPVRTYAAPMLPLIDDAGHLHFVNRFSAASYMDVIRAADAGLINGDPRGLFLIRQAFAGGPWYAQDWQTLLDLLLISERMLEHLGGAADGIQAALGVIQRAREAMRRRMPRWTQRQVTTDRLQSMVKRKHWSTGELASLLGCTDDEAGAVLEYLGYAPSPGAEWLPRTDAAGHVLEAVRDVIRVMPGRVYEPHLDEDRLLGDHLEDRLRTGAITPRQLDDYRVAGALDEVVSPGPTAAGSHGTKRRAFFASVVGGLSIAALARALRNRL
jgi:hypothetical protein